MVTEDCTLDGSALQKQKMEAKCTLNEASAGWMMTVAGDTRNYGNQVH